MGYALIVRKGATKEDFDDQIGIHPTNSEEFVYMDKLYEAEAQKTGC